MFKVVLFHKAQKSYKKLPQEMKRRVNRAIDQLQDNPFYGKDIKPLKGPLEDNYRMRVGDYRIVYAVQEKEALVVVKALGPRGKIYK